MKIPQIVIWGSTTKVAERADIGRNRLAGGEVMVGGGGGGRGGGAGICAALSTTGVK